MKILVVGGGGREHAIVMKLSKSPKVTELHCAPGNGGISRYAVCHPIKATDIDGMLALAQEIQADWVFVAPDDPLALGMVDVLSSAGFHTFGPTKAAAVIESSKVFSKGFMQKYQIPTASYEIFDHSEKALAYIREKNQYPAVIKADGLAMGKGAVLAENYDQAVETIHSIMEDKIFGESGSRVVIEDFLTGPEVTVLAFCDGETIRPMVSSMDHKRALEHDEGLNTGGMGTIAPSPFYTDAVAQICMETIFQPTVQAMKKEGRPFSGCLYFGLMLTPNGPQVIEYNARFGDPETQVVLSLLETDLVDIMEAVDEHRLKDLNIQWKDQSAACIILASGGYPGKYDSGLEITGLNENGQTDGAVVFHSGTRYENEKFYTAGGRVLGVTTIADTLSQALRSAYAVIESPAAGIRFDHMHYRKDIGHRAVSLQ